VAAQAGITLSLALARLAHPQDHVPDSIAMVKHVVGLTVKNATILSVDRLGLNMMVEKEGHQPFKLRLPFPR
jgi:hypothetical protein